MRVCLLGDSFEQVASVNAANDNNFDASHSHGLLHNLQTNARTQILRVTRPSCRSDCLATTQNGHHLQKNHSQGAQSPAADGGPCWG